MERGGGGRGFGKVHILKEVGIEMTSDSLDDAAGAAGAAPLGRRVCGERRPRPRGSGIILDLSTIPRTAAAYPTGAAAVTAAFFPWKLTFPSSNATGMVSWDTSTLAAWTAPPIQWRWIRGKNILQGFPL